MRIVSGEGFSGWHALNDTIMGGRSSGSCRVSSQGLVLDAEVVAEGGGFVSIRSPLFSPPLDLSAASAFELVLRGDGRRYKLAVACADPLSRLGELIPGGLRWVAGFRTEPGGPSHVRIPFSSLRPSVRAKPLEAGPLGLPAPRFDPARISRLQLLHSRFGEDGGANPGFQAGPLHLELLSIDAVA